MFNKKVNKEEYKKLYDQFSDNYAYPEIIIATMCERPEFMDDPYPFLLSFDVDSVIEGIFKEFDIFEDKKIQFDIAVFSLKNCYDAFRAGVNAMRQA